MLSRLLVGVLIGAAAIPAPAAAAPGVPQTSGPQTAGPQATGRTGTARVTLITGDTVELTKINDRYAATVRPAPDRTGITFHTVEADGGLRVLPSDAIPLVDAGRVDAELFDVERLVAQGYGDAASATLPLIVQGGAALRTAGAHALTSIDAAAIRPAKDTLASFWKAQSAEAQTSAETHIWLDGKVRPALDRSTTQIGAPAAWQAGLDGRGVKVAVLDTGADANHPDLAGQIAGARDFSGSAGTADRFGHGTHVAATVAGTGAGSAGTGSAGFGSAGRRKGVAYGAELLIGKVLGDDGYGYESQIIEGMQWAVAQGAKVVNMSLGGEATDGTDPMSMAVDEISAASGALFVVAAGNEGADSTVGTPGAARDALTVGAVDRGDQLADFSSRGPRLGDQGLKPEITAPGVDIVAARAAGTTMGGPVDELYTAASGTSMATPHVAGAAALLAQQHPDWTGAQIKEALVSTAKTTPETTVYEQGAGRVDLTRATSQTVTGTGVADFGLHTVGETPAVATRTVTYTNAGTTPVTLALQQPATVDVSASTVTVPAHGTAAVTVSVDFGKRDTGRLSGWLTATGPGGITVTTAIGATLDGPTHRVTVRAVDRTGTPVPVPALTIHGDDSRFDVLSWFGTAGRTFEVQEGTYLLGALIEDGAPLDEQATLTTIPELKVDRDVEVLVDARTGTPIRIETPKPAEQQAVLSYYVHRVTGTGRSIAHGVMHFSTIEQVNVVPTRTVAKGSFEFSSRWQLVAPMVRALVPGVSGPLDINLFGISPAYSGTRRFPLTTWGAASVRGKAVLIPATDEDELAQIDAAAAAGAAVAMMVRPADRSAWTVYEPQAEERLPVISLAVAHDTGQQLLARAARPGATIDLTLTTSSPYLYDVLQVSKDRVPDRIVHKVTSANSMRITSRYAYNGGLDWVREQRFGWRPWQTYAWNDTSRAVKTPSVREEWVSVGDSIWQHRVHPAYPWGEGALTTGFTDRPQSYAAGHAAETWAAPVVRPAAPAGVASTRTGDVLHLRVAEFVDSDGHYSATGADQAAATLWRDGTQIAELPDAWQDVTTTPGTAAYKLRLTTARGGEDWQFGTRTETEWTFRSGTEGTLPLLHVGYDAAQTALPHLLKLGFSAKVSTLKVELSTDDGATWKRAATVGEAALVPAGRAPVSVRVSATDKAGNTVTQTVIRAYGRG